MLSRRTNYILLTLLALTWVYMVYVISSSSDKQMDFKTYYYAAKVASLGEDAYDVTYLSNNAGSKITLPYAYPPVTLWFFKPFTFFTYEVAYQIWLFFKLALLAALLMIWWKAFVKEESSSLFYLFCTIAYAGPIYWDLTAGNICILEQFLVWSGLYFLIKEKFAWFTLAIVAVSLFKLTFISFLILPFVLDRSVSRKYFISGVAAFALILLADYLIETQYFAKYISIAIGIDERGVIFNPAILSLTRDICDLYLPALGVTPTPIGLPVALYLIAVSAIIFVSWKAVFGASSSSPLDKIGKIFFFCFVYALAMPRFRNYSYILLLPPTYYVITTRAKSIGKYLLLFVLLSLTKLTPLPFSDLPRFLWWYYSLFLALLVWLVFLNDIRKAKLS